MHELGRGRYPCVPKTWVRHGLQSPAPEWSSRSSSLVVSPNGEHGSQLPAPDNAAGMTRSGERQVRVRRACLGLRLELTLRAHEHAQSRHARHCNCSSGIENSRCSSWPRFPGISHHGLSSSFQAYFEVTILYTHLSGRNANPHMSWMDSAGIRPMGSRR